MLTSLKNEWLYVKKEINERHVGPHLYPIAFLEKLDASKIPILNQLWLLHGEIIPMQQVASMDIWDTIFQELYSFYELKPLFQLHESTILQLFFLLPYVLNEPKYQQFDQFNREEDRGPVIIAYSNERGEIILHDNNPPSKVVAPAVADIVAPEVVVAPEAAVNAMVAEGVVDVSLLSKRMGLLQKHGTRKAEIESEISEIIDDIEAAQYDIQMMNEKLERTQTENDMIALVSAILAERIERLQKLKRNLTNVKRYMKKFSVALVAVSPVKQRQVELATAERKRKDQARHLQTNMTTEQIQRDQDRHLQANMTVPQIQRARDRQTRSLMSPQNLIAARLRDRREHFLPVAQQWDLRNPCEKCGYHYLVSVAYLGRVRCPKRPQL